MLGMDLAEMESACLGGGLPPAAEEQIRLAGKFYHQYDLAHDHLARAQPLAPGHLAVLIGFYRFYFYQNRLSEAREVAQQCLHHAARALGLATDWRDIQPGDADFSQWDSVLPRFYLFTLKGYGYLSLRLGDMETGESIIAKLRELDPLDRLGGSTLSNVLARIGHDDYADD